MARTSSVQLMSVQTGLTRNFHLKRPGILWSLHIAVGQLVDHRPAISRLLTGYKPAYSRLQFL